jgi:hypothetical protein
MRDRVRANRIVATSEADLEFAVHGR